MADMPTWEGFLIPTLRVMSDGIVRDRRTIYKLSAQAAGLDDQQMQEVYPSGKLRYRKRIGWGLSFLAKVGALDRPTRGNYVITDAGRQLVAKFPNGAREKEIRALADDPLIDIRAYVATSRSSDEVSSAAEEISVMTPIEQVQEGVARINDEVAAELLKRLRDREPEFFESAVVDLLLAMGYGGNGTIYSMLGAAIVRAAIEARTHPLSALFGFGRGANPR